MKLLKLYYVNLVITLTLCGVTGPYLTKLFGSLETRTITMMMIVGALITMLQQSFNKSKNEFMIFYGPFIIEIIITIIAISLILMNINEAIFIMIYQISGNFWSLFTSRREDNIIDILKEKKISNVTEFNGTVRTLNSVGLIYGYLLGLIIPDRYINLNIILIVESLYVVLMVLQLKIVKEVLKIKHQ